MKILFFIWAFFALAYPLLSISIAFVTKACFRKKYPVNIKLYKPPLSETVLSYLKWIVIAVIPILNIIATFICIFNTEEIIERSMAVIETRIIKEEN